VTACSKGSSTTSTARTAIKLDPSSWVGWTSRGFEVGVSLAQVHPQLCLLRCSVRPRLALTRFEFGQSRRMAENLARCVNTVATPPDAAEPAVGDTLGAVSGRVF
jgi:hypothetical protein